MGGCHTDYDERKYVSVSHRQGLAVAGMATQRLGIGWTLGARGWVMADYTYFGDQDYSEQQISAEYGMNLDEHLDLGVEGRFCHLGTGDGYYESEQWMAVAARATLRIDSRIRVSALAGTRPWDRERPWRMHLNVAFVSSNDLLATVELESEGALRFRCGAEYCYKEHFFFRAGMATQPLTLAFGLGLRYGNYSIDVAAEAHNSLGVTPQIGLVLWF